MAPIKEVTNSVEAQEIMPQVNRFCNALQEFKVNSTGSWLDAGEKIKFAKDKIKEIKAVRKDFLDPINELKEVTLGFFEPALTKLESIVDVLGKKMADWRNEQLEKERIAQEKADAEAQEKERLEKERLRKEAEEKEREAEAARKKAEDAEKQGNSKQVQVLVEKAETLQQEVKELKTRAKEVVVEAKDVKQKVEKIEDLHFRRYWKARIVDEKKIPREFLKPDECAINDYVSKNKEKASIPGVVVYFEDRPIG
jgi:chromosome segregation ATPase